MIVSPPLYVLEFYQENFQVIDGVVSYKNEDTGVRIGSRRAPVGQELGRSENRGAKNYWVITVSGVKRKRSHIVWFLETGKWPSKESIDHINGDSHDDRFENLRECTLLENSQNMGKISGGEFNGIVRYRTKAEGWFAKVTCEGNSYYGLGENPNDHRTCEKIIRETKEEAARDYDWLKLKVLPMHGIDPTFSSLNFPGEPLRHPTQGLQS